MKLIPLVTTKEVKYYAQVDDEDYDYLMQWKWCVSRPKKGIVYALRSRKDSNGKTLPQIRMHRDILNVTDKNLDVDHKDHNTLNNQKSNLRIATRAQNSFNRKPRGKSKYLGVSWVANRWLSTIVCGSEYYYLGRFKNEEDAARARDKKAKEIHGEFANLNFPNE